MQFSYFLFVDHVIVGRSDIRRGARKVNLLGFDTYNICDSTLMANTVFKFCYGDYLNVWSCFYIITQLSTAFISEHE